MVFHHNADWKDFYGDIEEELPAWMPEPLGNPVTISAFVDENHAGNVVMRRSHTEFVALRICKEQIVALRYKLRMFGVPIDGPVNVFSDNRGVVKNASIPESTLMKKHNSINYHHRRLSKH